MNKEESSIEDIEDSMSDGASESVETIPLSEYEKIKDEYLRLAADFDNFKKRSEKERDSIGNASIAYFVESLFPLIDNFEIALSQDNVNEEIKTLGNMLSTVLNTLQIEEIGAHGEDFDPNIHEAVEHSGNGESQKVESVLRKGYLFQGNLIRPAMVKVKSE